MRGTEVSDGRERPMLVSIERRSIYLGFDLDLVARNKKPGQRPDTLTSGFGESDDGYLSMRVTYRTFALSKCDTHAKISVVTIPWLKTTHLMQNEHPRPRT